MKYGQRMYKNLSEKKTEKATKETGSNSDRKIGKIAGQTMGKKNG